MNPASTRRQFLRAAALATAATPILTTSSTASAATVPPAAGVSGVFLGPQAWTFRLFSVMEAIEFASVSGSTIIEFFPGQKFSKESPDLKWDHNATEDQHKAVADQLAKFRITPMNYGVVGIPNQEAEARKIFEFARKWNLYGVTTESVESVDLLEKLAREYNIKVCYHNHPRQPNNPNYKVWDPKFVLELVKDRDPRLGACADTGHWIRSGLNALECLDVLKERVHSMHLKDRLDAKGEDQIFGRGTANVPAMLEAVRSRGFKGNVSIEYETNWEKSLPDVSQCVGFVRALGQLKGWS